MKRSEKQQVSASEGTGLCHNALYPSAPKKMFPYSGSSNAGNILDPVGVSTHTLDYDLEIETLLFGIRMPTNWTALKVSKLGDAHKRRPHKTSKN